MTKDQQTKEWIILIGLFRSTVEQSTLLTGQTKQECKMIFNKWFKEGDRLCKLIERESYDLDLDEVTDVIQDSINKLRTKVLI